MKSIGCYFGSHTLEVVAANNAYYTNYVDTNYQVYHTMRFYRCKHCGHRTFKTNYKSPTGVKHNGIEIARDNWIDLGMVPESSYDPRTSGYIPAPTPTKPKTATVVPFEVIKGDKQ